MTIKWYQQWPKTTIYQYNFSLIFLSISLFVIFALPHCTSLYWSNQSHFSNNMYIQYVYIQSHFLFITLFIIVRNIYIIVQCCNKITHITIIDNQYQLFEYKSWFNLVYNTIIISCNNWECQSVCIVNLYHNVKTIKIDISLQ